MCQSRLQHTIGTHRGNSEENLRKGLSADVEADLREPIGDIGAPRTLAAAGGCFLSEVERARGRDGVTEPAEDINSTPRAAGVLLGTFLAALHQVESLYPGC